jgi:hypothetical protein
MVELPVDHGIPMSAMGSPVDWRFDEILTAQIRRMDRARRHHRDGVLQIGAWDADPEPPEPPHRLEEFGDAESGRGMALVRACSDVWHWQPLSRMGHRGKLVWCELKAG